MDLLGHCEIALRSGLHDADEVYGEGLLDLMLPNMMHCHDWAYASMWNIGSQRPDLLPAARLVRSHVVADWVIHYGDEATHFKRKVGWAYRRMGLAKAGSEKFFSDATSAGLLRPDAALPHEWSKKQKLDFNHSIVEYSLDLLLAASLPARHFHQIKAALSRLQGSDGACWRAHVRQRFCDLGASSDHEPIFLARSVEAMALDAVVATRPDHFAIATVVRKYGFVDEPRTYTFVRRFLEDVASQMNSEDIEATLASIARVVADPQSIYTGDYCVAGESSPTGAAVNG